MLTLIFSQLYQASNALYVLSIGCSKATVAYSTIRLVSSAYPSMVRLSRVLFIATLLWTFALLLLFLLFDHPASPWQFIGHPHAIWVSNSSPRSSTSLNSVTWIEDADVVDRCNGRHSVSQGAVLSWRLSPPPSGSSGASK